MCPTIETGVTVRRAAQIQVGVNLVIPALGAAIGANLATLAPGEVIGVNSATPVHIITWLGGRIIMLVLLDVSVTQPTPILTQTAGVGHSVLVEIVRSNITIILYQVTIILVIPGIPTPAKLPGEMPAIQGIPTPAKLPGEMPAIQDIRTRVITTPIIAILRHLTTSVITKTLTLK